MFARVAGAFRKTRPQVRVLGAYRQVRNVFVLVGDAWRPAWSYAWDVGGWGGCSVTCGGGTQTRTVRCLRSDGVEMADAFCSQAGSKPVAAQSCNTHPCYTYGWDWESWGSCSASCGYGTRYRSVWCRRSDGASVGSSYCASFSKPATSESCYAGKCVTYSWYSGSWGSCPSACGATSQTRSVYCKGSDGSSYADSKCSGSKPGTSQSCSNCTGCRFNEYAYINNKTKQCTAIKEHGISNWTTSLVRQAILKEGYTPEEHAMQYSRSEGVCPYSSSACCSNLGYRYY